MVPDNPFHPDFRPNPYPLYHYLRSTEPVHRSVYGWLLTRYDDCVRTLDDPRVSHDVEKASFRTAWNDAGFRDQPLHSLLKSFLNFQDPPGHTELRLRLGHALQRGLPTNDLAKSVSLICESLLQPARAAGEFDVVNGFARPLVAALLADAFDIADEDVPRLMRWVSELTPAVDPLRAPTVEAVATRAELALIEHFMRAAGPTHAGSEDGILSALLDVDGDSAMSTWDAARHCAFLITFAQEPTTHAIGNSLLALLNHPEQWALLCEAPERARAIVDELLRYDSPVQLTWRTTLEDMDVAGARVPAGDDLVLMLGAANRDPARFPDPDRLDLGRQADGHLAFSSGAHRCLGEEFARTVVGTAIEAFARLLPSVALDGEIQWGQSFVVRGASAIRVRLAS